MLEKSRLHFSSECAALNIANPFPRNLLIPLHKPIQTPLIPTGFLGGGSGGCEKAWWGDPPPHRPGSASTFFQPALGTPPPPGGSYENPWTGDGQPPPTHYDRKKPFVPKAGRCHTGWEGSTPTHHLGRGEGWDRSPTHHIFGNPIQPWLEASHDTPCWRKLIS